MIATWALVAATALLVGCTAFYAWQTRQLVEQMAGQKNLSSLFEIVVQEYLDRQFMSTTAPTIDGERVSSVRQAKRYANELLTTDSDKWNEACRIGNNTWENKLAFELSVAIERLGVSVFSGVLSIRFFFTLAADQILEDWLLCYPWVRSYREKQNVYTSHRQPFHRRYGEWLVLLAAVWMDKNCPAYQPLQKVQEIYGGRDRLKQELLNRSWAEQNTMNPSVKHEINAVLGIKLRRKKARKN